jgi:hypothetical protein
LKRVLSGEALSVKGRNLIKIKDEMGGSIESMGEMRNPYRILDGNPKLVN